MIYHSIEEAFLFGPRSAAAPLSARPGQPERRQKGTAAAPGHSSDGVKHAGWMRMRLRVSV